MGEKVLAASARDWRASIGETRETPEELLLTVPDSSEHPILGVLHMSPPGTLAPRGLLGFACLPRV